MQYGYFDEKNKEYVITKQDTPAPWANYLGSPEYGVIISNNAGGYSFVKSGAKGRIIRYRFNAIDRDQAGRYIYIKDMESGDYWSGSWQPVGKDQEKYKSECHHGTAYTRITSSYDSITTNTLYYVPLNKTYEVWSTKVKNNDNKNRKLSLFGYVEFTNDSDYEQDTVNLQYTQFITKTYFKEDMILQVINENNSEVGGSATGDSDVKGEPIYRFFGAAGESVKSYDGDRDIFVGDYRNYSNPVSVERGKCSNITNYNGNACGALQFDLELQAGEERQIIFVLGAYGEEEGRKIIKRYENLKVVDIELKELKDFWHSKLNRFQIKAPSEELNNMINVWNSYQCFITFIWSRAASFTYCGLRNGLGYRDTVQDIQGIIHLDSELALERLKLMLSAQVSNGGGLPLVKFNHNPGHEFTPEDPEYGRETGHPYYRADDALWLFPTVMYYLKESGNWEFVDEVIPFSDKGEGSVYEHLRRAINFSMERLGEHGLPAGLHADWNDCLRLGSKGESTFVTFQLYLALKTFKELAVHKGDEVATKWSEALLIKLDENIQNYCWDEDRFIRGITEDNYIVGAKDNEEANLWLNPQSWAVISGAAKESQAKAAMDTVYDRLNTEHGVMLFYPAFRKYGLPVARMSLMNPGTKENAGIFSQTQGWAILAETIIGNGNRAFQYFKESCPAAMNSKAEIRKIEPYVHGQFIEGIDSPFFGRANVHWLTGTASTMMVGLVQGILGVQPEFNGLRINPCIPREWKEFTMYREFRGKKFNIVVNNTAGVEKGVSKIVVNGEELQGSLIPESIMKEINEVVVFMGQIEV